MADQNESRMNDSMPGSQPERVGNAIAWAWGRGFIIGAMLIVLIYESLIVLLVPDRWQIEFMPLCIIPVHGLALYINYRRKNAVDK